MNTSLSKMDDHKAAFLLVKTVIRNSLISIYGKVVPILEIYVITLKSVWQQMTTSLTGKHLNYMSPSAFDIAYHQIKKKVFI